jgi:hypothetical protein
VLTDDATDTASELLSLTGYSDLQPPDIKYLTIDGGESGASFVIDFKSDWIIEEAGFLIRSERVQDSVPLNTVLNGNLN